MAGTKPHIEYLRIGQAHQLQMRALRENPGCGLKELQRDLAMYLVNLLRDVSHVFKLGIPLCNLPAPTPPTPIHVKPVARRAQRMSPLQSLVQTCILAAGPSLPHAQWAFIRPGAGPVPMEDGDARQAPSAMTRSGSIGNGLARTTSRSGSSRGRNH